MRVIPTEQYFSMVRQMLSENGEASIRITGMSMWPLLHHVRDSVVIVPPDRIRVGDIVLYDRRNERYALHRVIRKRKNDFWMAGDHQWHFEKDLPYDQIIGVVTQVNRNGKILSCKKPFMLLYAFIAAHTAVPRILVYRFLRKLLHLFHPAISG